jgi:ubiquinone/menaquinone biosynthesis C-methylase UbiE
MPNDTVLDLGCGPSSPFASLDVKMNVGIDITLQPQVQADAECLPFRDDSFTFVVANHSMEHIPDLDACLRELKRVMTSIWLSLPDFA